MRTSFRLASLQAILFLLCCVVVVAMVSVLRAFVRHVLPRKWATPYNHLHISPQWLTKALQNTGVLASGQSISGFKIHDLRQDFGHGFTSALYEFVLNFDGLFSLEDADCPPSSLVVKVLHDSFESRVVATSAHFASEIDFYNSVATSKKMEKVGFRVPKVYCAKQFMQSDFLLVMEKVQSVPYYRCAPPWVTPDAAQIEVMERILRHMAKFHASFWEDPDTKKFFSPSSFGRAQAPLFLTQLIVSDPKWKEAIAEYIPADFDLERLCKACFNATKYQMAGPHTLIHGDLRLANFLWESVPGTTEPSPVLIDWQLSSLGKVGSDIGPLMVWELPSEVRRAVEIRLLEVYLEELHKNGVPETFTFDNLFKQYKVGIAMRAFTKVAIGTQDFEKMDDNEKKELGVFLKNTLVAIQDLSITEVLESL